MRRKISELFQMLFISVHKLYSESLLPFFWVGPGFVTWQWLTRHYFSLNWCIFRAFDSWWLLGTASMLWKCCSGAFLLALQGKALIFIWFGCCLFNLPLGVWTEADLHRVELCIVSDCGINGFVRTKARPWGASNCPKHSLTKHQQNCVIISLCWYSDMEMFSPLQEWTASVRAVNGVRDLLFLSAAGYSLPGIPERWHLQAWLAV